MDNMSLCLLVNQNRSVQVSPGPPARPQYLLASQYLGT